MAIIGTGIDIVDIPRLSRVIASYGQKFLGRVFTPAEAALYACSGGGRAAAGFAGRFAAKEAFYKALPLSVQPLSSWKSIQTLSNRAGRPYIEVIDERLWSALFTGMRASFIHLSISHERAYCVASVIIE